MAYKMSYFAGVSDLREETSKILLSFNNQMFNLEERKKIPQFVFQNRRK